MSRDHKSILAKLDHGPVVLAQRSKPAAVLVSIEEWNRIALRLQEYERANRLRDRVRGKVLREDLTLDQFIADIE